MRGQSRGAAPALTEGRPVQGARAGARDRPDSTLELLLDCVTARRLAESRARLHKRLAEPIDWDATLDAARGHGVAPLVHQELRAAPEGLVPPAALAPLQQFNLENTRRCLLLTGWLRRVVDGLERAGVQAIPYKGPVLAALAYGAMGARQAGDLDLLIDPGHLQTAKEALRADGFRPQVPLQDWQERQLVRSAHPYGLVRDAEHIVLELHWSVSPRSLSSGLGRALPRERLEEVAVAGTPHAPGRPAPGGPLRPRGEARVGAALLDRGRRGADRAAPRPRLGRRRLVRRRAGAPARALARMPPGPRSPEDEPARASGPRHRR
jgi:hypothetical protein